MVLTVPDPLPELPAEFAQNAEEFDALLRKANLVVDLDAEIPAWSFREQSGIVDVFDDDELWSDEANDAVDALAQHFGDELIHVIGQYSGEEGFKNRE